MLLDFWKGEGIISFNVTSTVNETVHEIEEIKTTYVGTVNVEDFVFDEKAWKSGYALYFYGDINLNKPYTGHIYTNYMYKRCVTLQDIDNTSSNNCKIKYSLGESIDIKTYDMNELSRKMTITEWQSSNYQYGNEITSYYNNIDYDKVNRLSKLCQSYIKTKLEIFKKYIEVFTEDFQSKCTN